MRRILVSFALVVSLSAFSSVQAEDSSKETVSPEVASNTISTPTLQDGQDAFNVGNYDLAFSHWQTLATQGDTEAQVFVGLSYANGWGVDKDTRLASVWYQKAALKDNTSGQFLLGLYLISGDDADLARGVMWLRRAAENGDESAIRFMKKASLRGWFKNVPTIKFDNKSRPIEAVALAGRS